MFFDYLRLPFGYKFFYKQLKKNTFVMLDVGCGSHAPSIAKKSFPLCVYHGVDLKIYRNSAADMELIDKFYDIDLNNDYNKLESLPDDYYDLIYMSHIIEHLWDGLAVLKILTKKLKKGGTIYIEFPSTRSLSLPSMQETLNFCDDDTHVRVYSVREISNLLLAGEMHIIKAGVRRDKIKIFLFPIKFILRILLGKGLIGGLFWDITGFASYVYSRKK